MLFTMRIDPRIFDSPSSHIVHARTTSHESSKSYHNDHHMNRDFSDKRREYSGVRLQKENLPGNPFDLFDQWYREAEVTEGNDVTVMTLATATENGNPSARIVLLKGVDTGFLFFTNYLSRKGKELAENGSAALVFWWRGQNRQVRIEGNVEKLTEGESDEYFDSRPVGSRVGAIASLQSEVIDSESELADRVALVQNRFDETGSLSRPAHWGGYRLVPRKIEFWQGQPDRLHDRYLYSKEHDGWTISRLYP